MILISYHCDSPKCRIIGENRGVPTLFLFHPVSCCAWDCKLPIQDSPPWGVTLSTFESKCSPQNYTRALGESRGGEQKRDTSPHPATESHASRTGSLPCFVVRSVTSSLGLLCGFCNAYVM